MVDHSQKKIKATVIKAFVLSAYTSTYKKQMRVESDLNKSKIQL